MTFDLPGLLSAPEVTAWAAAVALIVAILQQLSFVPLPDGSRARAWAVALISAGIIALTSTAIAAPDAGTFILAAVMSWAALAGASLGINRAGSYTVQAVQNQTSGG